MRYMFICIYALGALLFLLSSMDEDRRIQQRGGYQPLYMKAFNVMIAVTWPAWLFVALPLAGIISIFTPKPSLKPTNVDHNKQS